MLQDIKIPEDRIGALIGKSGLTKKKVEEATKTRITVESREGVTHVEGEEAEGVLRAVEVISAIGRGFSPERAFTLLEDEDLILDIIDISPEADSPRQFDRMRGRIIGKDGRSREQIEHMTGTSLSVYGKTVAVIGLPDQIKLARTAIDMLIKGVPHESVFSFLEKKKREAKQDMLSYYY
ncbi:MAG: KH domain-containing protein [Methanoregulaceae archaeon]|nr:KH domain-containing protein [Methanoregulaceae archaeon]